VESIILQVFAIVLGASIGSFLNVVIYRLPAGLSLLFPPSRCPHCLKALSPRDNIPILGWFLIKGKCRYCHSPVSWRYPLVELITAFLFWLVAVVIFSNY
jgi:leader peptidase (prepilin peptidase) / N-methyltransferase